MQLHELTNKKKNKKRIARGGAHGKTSGRGTKARNRAQDIEYVPQNAT